MPLPLPNPDTLPAAPAGSAQGDPGQPFAARALRASWVTPLLIGAALLTGCASWLPGSQAPVDAPATPATPAGPSLRLDVQAPPVLKALLEQHLDLARLQRLGSDEAPDNIELARLLAAAPAQARDLLQTEGYFDPQVSVQRETANPGELPRAQLQVVPGPRSSVSELALTLEGSLRERLDANEAGAQALLRNLREPPVLTPGKAFRNAEWADTKFRLLTRLRAAGYAAAQIQRSSADIDTAAAQARLSVVLDSGPRFVAGELTVLGLQHHDRQTVLNLAGFGPGAPLTETLLLDYQDRLQKSGLFDGVAISFDPDPAQAEAAGVSVKLSERPLQQAQVGVGVSANTGPRASVEHTHRRPFGAALVLHNKAEWGRDLQSFAGDISTHPGEGFYRNLAGVLIERVRSATDVVQSQRLRLGRTTDTPQFERLYFLEALNSRRSDATGVDSAQALSANAHLVIRKLDSVLLPTRGYSLSLQGGLGEAKSGSHRPGPFVRAYARLTGYLPLGGDWFGQARLEAGQIIKRNDVEVPDALGFRAGGDDSVRGYAYRTLAPTSAGATVSGDVLLTASLEVAHPLVASLPAVQGALFVDAGRAAAAWGDSHAAVGSGAGLRWRSPIGPLRADLAWGQETRKLRLHFSVGIVF